MADSKKYDGSQWQHSLRKYTTATEIVQNPLYSDGTAISTYSIKGNTVQSGTPTPSAPISVQGTGNKTANLLPTTIAWYLNNNASALDKSDVSDIRIKTDIFPVSDTNAYLTVGGFNLPNIDGLYLAAIRFYSDDLTTPLTTSGSGNTRAIPTGAKWASLLYGTNSTTFDTSTIKSQMQAAQITAIYGQTAPSSYIPYGYKIPISSGGVTNNIYLGSVQSTRPIRKLVFTGTENFTKVSGRDYIYTYSLTYLYKAKTTELICTHLPMQTSLPVNGGFCISSDLNTSYMNFGAEVMDIQPSGDTVDGLKEYLASQYANGTPVIVYYPLQNNLIPTGIVNEPLMKIGDYADSISNAVAIPTTEGANSITVDTTVQPSEFTATWTGWHDSSVKEYQGGVGNQKFDYTTMASGITGYYLSSAGVETESNAWAITDYIPCNGQSFTLGKIGGNAPAICLYDSNKTFIAGQAYNTGGADFKNDITVTASQNAKYIRFSYFIASPAVDLSTIMLNEGTTALPYEPYEYGWA